MTGTDRRGGPQGPPLSGSSNRRSTSISEGQNDPTKELKTPVTDGSVERADDGAPTRVIRRGSSQQTSEGEDAAADRVSDASETTPIDTSGASAVPGRVAASEEPKQEAPAGGKPSNEAEHQQPPSKAAGQKPAVVEGIELVGKYEGSGYKEDPYIARRSDGQMVQLSELLYLVAENCDGQRSYHEIAERVAKSFGKNVSADNVEYLVENKLRPLGIVTQADGSSPQPPKQDALLALKFKKTLLPEGGVNAVGALFKPLFWPVVILPVLAAVIAVDVWYFATHGIGQSMRDLLYNPLMILAVYMLLIVSIGWHEIGHATGCRYGGARPGVIGFGIYVVWPAFYCDVTDTYRLGKGGRVRTDLGGIYFNLIFALASAGLYFLTRFEPLLVLILIQHLLIVYNFIPFLRMDGYYVISDLTGVPDLFGRVKPTIKSLVPGQEPQEEVVELKRWVRVVVTAWVLTVIPLLLYLFVMMVISAPRVIATGFDSFLVQSDKLGNASGDGNWAQVAVSVFRILFLVLPMAAMSLTMFRVVKRVAAGAWNMTEERPIMRGLTGVTVTACAVFAAVMLWPNGEYRPIQEGERWTLSDSFEAVSEAGTGRPSLTENQQESLEGAPGVYESESEESSSETETTETDETDGSTDEESTETEPSPEPTPSAVEPTPTPTPEA